MSELPDESLLSTQGAVGLYLWYIPCLARGRIVESLADDLTTTARAHFITLGVTNEMTEEKAPKIDFKVLDAAVKKVLSAPPQPKRKPSPKR